MNLAAALLVVDDDEGNRYTLAGRLKREGYTNVTMANDGRQALQLLHSRRFDLVLLDIMMPELNGYQVLEHLKASPELRHVPVIMITTEGGESKVMEAVQLGASGYVRKPFTADQIKEKLAGLF